MDFVAIEANGWLEARPVVANVAERCVKFDGCGETQPFRECVGGKVGQADDGLWEDTSAELCGEFFGTEVILSGSPNDLIGGEKHLEIL